MHWVNFGGHYINLDQIVDIITGEKRVDFSKPFPKDGNVRPLEPCIIFVRPVAEKSEGEGGHEEIRFFGEERQIILDWLQRTSPLQMRSLDMIVFPERPAPLPEGADPRDDSYDPYLLAR